MFSRKIKKDHEELRDKYDKLEDKYDDLQDQHDRLQTEAGEKTNVRISYIEEEIESMNVRVEKLANDSYAIHHEVRDIHESVLEMRTSLSEIVSLYKAILTKYGVAGIQPPPRNHPPREAERPRTPGTEPGEDIIRALERDQRSQGREAGAKQEPLQSRTVPPRLESRPSAPSAAPQGSSTLDELHRISDEQRLRDVLESDSLAERVSARSSKEDRVTRVAKRDMKRMEYVDRQGEGEFTRSLPRKEVGTPAPKEGPRKGDGWEAMKPPPDTEPGRDRDKAKSKPRLKDLLSPE
jgi:hypothetical protein